MTADSSKAMKLAKIENYRCGEWSDNDWVWIPVEMTEDELSGLASKAVQSYLDAENAMKNAVSMPDPGWAPQYERFPDKPVAEVKRIHDIAKEKFAQHKKIIEAARKPFAAHLVRLSDNRIKLFNDFALETAIEVNWGHNHGKTLIYGTSTPHKERKDEDLD